MKKNRNQQLPMLVVISDGSTHKKHKVPVEYKDRCMMIFHVPSSQHVHAAAISRLVDYQVFFPKGTTKQTISFYEQKLGLEKVIAPIKLPSKVPRKKKKREIMGVRRLPRYSPPKPKNSHE